MWQSKIQYVFIKSLMVTNNELQQATTYTPMNVGGCLLYNITFSINYKWNDGESATLK